MALGVALSHNMALGVALSHNMALKSLQLSVAFHIKTSHLFCTAKQVTAALQNK